MMSVAAAMLLAASLPGIPDAPGLAPRGVRVGWEPDSYTPKPRGLTDAERRAAEKRERRAAKRRALSSR